jgi:mannan endo-1,4-beta-mannosidase
LDEFKDSLILNVANEWYGSWDQSRNYADGVKLALRRLRQSGLSHLLVFDARGYGQDFGSILDHAADFMATDANVVLSAHMYDLFGDAATVSAQFKAARAKRIPFIVGEFSCQHLPEQPVACDTIMAEASAMDRQVGYVGWSWSGNAGVLKGLDVVSANDWTTLTPWGARLVDSPNGIRATSRPACHLDSSGC